jgi:hypothetical protein
LFADFMAIGIDAGMMADKLLEIADDAAPSRADNQSLLDRFTSPGPKHHTMVSEERDCASLVPMYADDLEIQ